MHQEGADVVVPFEGAGPYAGAATSREQLADNLIHRVNVGDSLTRTAARYPRRTAVVDGSRRWNYAEFDEWVDRLGHGLLARGHRPGDALALLSGNSAEFLAVYYACAKTGIISVPLNPAWNSDEMGYVLRHCGARGLVIESDLVERLVEIRANAPEVRDVLVTPGSAVVPEAMTSLDSVLAAPAPGPPQVVVCDRDPVSYMYTSGTTAFPKGVISHHLGIYLESLALALEARFTEDDRFAAMLPLFHVAQLNTQCTSAVMIGASVYVMRGFDAGELLALIERESITQIFGLPSMYRDMIDHPDLARRDIRSLRRACYAMAPMPEELLRRAIDKFGCEFYLLFGQTEMSPTTTLFRPEHQLAHPGAVGTTVTNVQLAIMGEQGELLPPGREGEIVYRGPHTMTGYRDDPAATAAAFAGGWFHSGDIGVVDEHGMLRFRDRSKDVIKASGENVASLEVERALLSDPSVDEVAVIGLPHDRYGEAVTAVIVPAAGHTVDLARLRVSLDGQLARYKHPVSVVLVGTLPRTSSGKIQKNLLRERYADHHRQQPLPASASRQDADTSSHAASDLAHRVRALAAGLLGRPAGDIDPRQPFHALGFDSLLSVVFRDRLAQELGIELPAAIVFDHPTPDQLAGHLTRLLLEQPPDAAVGPSQALTVLEHVGLSGLTDTERRRLATLAGEAAPRVLAPVETMTDEQLFDTVDKTEGP